MADGEQGDEPKERSRWQTISQESILIANSLAFVAVIVLLCLGGTYPQSDIVFSHDLKECLKRTSWAPATATSVAESLDGQATNHASLDGVESAWTTLVLALEKHADEDALWLGYGTGKGQFYSAVNCEAAREATTSYCMDSGARFILKAKSTPVFGDDFVHRYKYVEGGKTGGGSFEEVSTGEHPYYPRARPWFYFGMGASVNGTWGQYHDTYDDFQTAAFGITYDGGVVSAAISPKASACFAKWGPEASKAAKTL